MVLFFQLASLKRRKNDKRTHNVYVKPKNIISHGRISEAQHFGLICNVRRINRRKKEEKPLYSIQTYYCIQLVFVFVFLQRIKLKHDPNLCKMLSIFVFHSSFFSICACLHLSFSPRIYVFFDFFFFVSFFSRFDKLIVNARSQEKIHSNSDQNIEIGLAQWSQTFWQLSQILITGFEIATMNYVIVRKLKDLYNF